jgi:hypothetical protein
MWAVLVLSVGQARMFLRRRGGTKEGGGNKGKGKRKVKKRAMTIYIAHVCHAPRKKAKSGHVFY